MNEFAIMIGLFVVAVILVVGVLMVNQEGMTGPYFDRIANLHPDPTYFYYHGDTKDVMGMSDRERYLENLFLENTGVIQPMTSAQKFMATPQDYVPRDILETYSDTY